MKINIAENIRNLRKKYNMKQEQLAEALDVSITAVSKWEREAATPELKYIVEMADLFEVSVDALLGYDIQNGACEAWEQRIHGLQKNKDFHSAIAEAEKALVRYPNDFNLIIRCAEVYYLNGIERGDKKSLCRAIELWEKSLLLISQNTNKEITEYSIWSEIASAHITLGEKEKGLELLQKFNINGMNNALIGLIYAKLEEFPPEKASSFLEKGFFSCMGELIRLMEGYTYYYERSGQYELALEAQLWMVQYLKSIKMNENASIADKFMALSYMKCAKLAKRLNKDDLAEQYRQQAVQTAKRFDEKPDYQISNLRFYIGEMKDGVVYESSGETAMDAIRNLEEEIENETLE